VHTDGGALLVSHSGLAGSLTAVQATRSPPRCITAAACARQTLLFMCRSVCSLHARATCCCHSAPCSYTVAMGLRQLTGVSALCMQAYVSTPLGVRYASSELAARCVHVLSACSSA